MEKSITIRVDCQGEWMEKINRFIWHCKDGKILETIPMRFQRYVLYDDCVNLIISYRD